MHSEQGAALVPAINATVWEQGISTRLALFRTWTWHKQKPSSAFLAGVQKLDGRNMEDVVDQAAAFAVETVSFAWLVFTRAKMDRYG
jgi:hypothetical protein